MYNWTTQLGLLFNWLFKLFLEMQTSQRKETMPQFFMTSCPCIIAPFKSVTT